MRGKNVPKEGKQRYKLKGKGIMSDKYFECQTKVSKLGSGGIGTLKILGDRASYGILWTFRICNNV